MTTLDNLFHDLHREGLLVLPNVVNAGEARLVEEIRESLLENVSFLVISDRYGRTNFLRSYLLQYWDRLP